MVLVLVCRWDCRALWFDFYLESSMKYGTWIITKNFTILSYLREFDCGEFHGGLERFISIATSTNCMHFTIVARI